MDAGHRIHALTGDALGTIDTPEPHEDADRATKKVKHGAGDEDHPGYIDMLLHGTVLECHMEDMLENDEIKVNEVLSLIVQVSAQLLLFLNL